MEKIFEYLNLVRPSLANLYNVANVGPGWLLGVFGAVAVSIYGLSIGRTRAILSLFSIYVAFVVEKFFPYFDNLQVLIGESVSLYWLRVSVFAAAYVLASLVFNYSFVKKRISSADFSLSAVILITTLQLGFLASILLGFLPESLGIQWSFGFYYYFVSPSASFLWSVMPIISIVFLKK